MADLVYFRVLGRPELTRGSASLPLVRRPRKLALFAVLALSRPPFRSRDTLQAMFWPESDQDHARKSLNTAVHGLRQDLGADVVLSRGDDEIGVAADLVWSDVRAFNEAIAAGDVEQALDLYGGDLMAGFFVKGGAPGFERWLDAERERLRHAAHGAAIQRAERAEHAGDIDKAVDWARRAAEMSFDDEPVVRRSIGLLDRTGDRMGAIHMFDRFARHLREEYDEKPAPETQRLIAKIRMRAEPHSLPEPPQRRIEPAKPDRTIAAASAAGPTETDAPSPTPRNREHPPSPEALTSPAPGTNRRLPARLVRSVLAVAAVVVAVGAVLWLTRASSIDVQATDEPGIVEQHTAERTSRPRIVISQFETLGVDSELAYLASAITAAVTQQLAEVSAIDVVTEEAYGRSVSTAARVDVRTASDPYFLVKGSVLPSPEQVRVSVELIDGSSGNVLRTASIDQPAEDVFGLIDEVAQQIGALLRTGLGREIQLRRWRAGTTNVRAFQLLHRAEVDRQRASTLEDVGSVAVAATQLSRADSLLVLAEAEDPEWVDPTVRRAQVASDAAWLFFPPPLHDTAQAQDWLESGIVHADRALARVSAHAAALELRGTLRYWSSRMAAPGEVDAAALLLRAENDFRSALSLDVDRARAWSLLSAILFARGDFANAYAGAERAYRADAYLEARDEILMRLVLAAHEVANDSIAWHWCSIITAEGDARPISGFCRLHLLAWGDERSAQPPFDPWAILDDVTQNTPSAQAFRPHLEMLTATVLAGRGLADSARAVAVRAARGDPDDEVLLFEAGARVALGEPDLAAALLRRYVTARPAHRLGLLKSRRFDAIEPLLEFLEPDDR